MSQSPLTDSDEDQKLSYQLGWRALNRLLHEGRSFSGNEKHCAFLNTGTDASGQQRPFADISSALGFDFPEDGRALGLIDWDCDGDLDFWLTNRTAPRIRFLRNNNASGAHFLALQLEGNGTTTNRDAIGAMVSVYLNGQSVPRRKSLKAGHSFLAQSTRWLHFGLGTDDQIDKVVVDWPAGGQQTFPGLTANQFHILTQNRGSRIWTRPGEATALQPSNPEPHPLSAKARIIVPPGMLVPELSTLDENRQVQPLPRNGEGLLLVNLWSSLCLPCREELGDWATDAKLFREAGIEVVALLTDGAGDPGLATAKKVIQDTRFPFPWMEAAPATVHTLDTFYAATLDLWNPLPVPSSFLLNQRGEAIAIYTGPVHASQIVADAKLDTATPEDRRNAAVPFPGRWVLPPSKGDSLRVSSQLLDNNQIDPAIDYLAHVTKWITQETPTAELKSDLGDAHYTRGVLLAQRLRLTEALQALQTAQRLLPQDGRIGKELNRIRGLRQSPDLLLAALRDAVKARPQDIRLLQEYGTSLLRAGRAEEARTTLTQLTELEPDNSLARYHLANALLDVHQPTVAITQLKRILSTDPRFIDAANRLAWILANHPDDKVRVPAEALVLAQRLAQITKNQNPRYLDTLATAHAANGDFKQATEIAEAALAIYAKHSTPAAQTKPLEDRLTSFQAQKPYRESRWLPKP